jgi:hypothetical protein
VVVICLDREKWSRPIRQLPQELSSAASSSESRQLTNHSAPDVGGTGRSLPFWEWPNPSMGDSSRSGTQVLARKVRVGLDRRRARRDLVARAL